MTHKNVNCTNSENHPSNCRPVSLCLQRHICGADSDRSFLRMTGEHLCGTKCIFDFSVCVFYRICQLAAVSHLLFTTWAVHFHVVSVVPLFASSSHGCCENEEVSHRSVSHFSMPLAIGLNFLTSLESSQQVFAQHTEFVFVIRKEWLPDVTLYIEWVYHLEFLKVRYMALEEVVCVVIIFTNGL